MMRKILFLVFWLFSHLIYAQNLAYSLQSPRHTVETHLKNLRSEHFYPKIAGKVFIYDGKYNAQELGEKAIQLKRIFDAQGIYVVIDAIPDSPNHLDSLSKKHIYILDKAQPKIYLEKIGRRWYYSKETLELIPLLYQKSYPLGTHRLLDLTEGFSDTTYLGLKIWQYVGMLIVAFSAILLYQIFAFINRQIAVRILARMRLQSLSETFFRPVVRPFSLLLVIILVIIAVRVLQLPSLLNYYLHLVLKACVPLLVTIIAYRFVDLLADYLQKAARKTETTLDDQLVPLFRKLGKAIVIIFGTVIVVQNLRFDITGLIAGISIGGLAFALAAQDTIRNLFGSLMILVDKPFKTGDYIKAPDIEGDVEEIGFRSTRIRSLHNSLIYVPNAKMADMTIDNLGMRNFRRFRTMIAITYDTPPEAIEYFIAGLKKIIEQNPHSRPDYKEVHLFELGATAYQILFQMHIIAPNFSEELIIRHHILMNIIRLANMLRVRFAFPTSTLHIENFPDKTSLTPTNKLNKEDYENLLHQFFEVKN